LVTLKKRRKKRKTTIKDWRQTKLISPQLKEKTLFKRKESKKRRKNRNSSNNCSSVSLKCTPTLKVDRWLISLYRMDQQLNQQ
jgi:hypothetical protein